MGDDGNKGHRERLRARFLDGGGSALPDYELLELLLFAALPRIDTKPIAKALLARHGSLAAVLSTPPEDLCKTQGVGESAAAFLAGVGEAGTRMARAELQARPVLSSSENVLAYCRAALGHRQNEAFHVLFLDRKNGLIADERQGDGTVDHTPVYPREVVKRALDLGASALIMVHNHPSGDPTPSNDDIVMTRTVRDAAAALDIALHDHIIVTRADHVSLRASGLI